jgi:hypothetical protein
MKQKTISSIFSEIIFTIDDLNKKTSFLRLVLLIKIKFFSEKKA